ncbi:MAG: FtsQ-type POTRA domain-containing protein [Clostridiales bacterium]|nr:FtsQ-type POTRA domain-containing protein [Clostridiales bacterium]
MSEQLFERYPPPDVPGVSQDHPMNSSSSDRQPLQGSESLEPDKQPSMTPGKRMMIISCVLIIMVSFAFILRSVVFTIRNIRVVGVHDVAWQDVALSAGLGPKSNYFNIKEGKIKEGINNNRYLVFERMQKIFPNTLIIYVKERKPLASINYIGVSYIMADDGVILSKSRQPQNQKLMSVSGLALRDIREGKVPLSTKIGQIETCVLLSNELYDQNFNSEIIDINLSEPSRIYLTTRDGYSVHLGDSTYLRAKIVTIRAVIDELRKRQYTGGVIEATVPGEATYRPDTL